MPADPGRFLEWLCAEEADPSSAPPVVLVAAHPDDETLGAGTRLPRLPGAVVVHLTDGAPRERRWWGAPEAPTREAYARLRREELRAALSLAGVEPERTRSLGRVDQEASLDLCGVARELAELFRELRPRFVLTHPYEGGHPDHDAAAFAVYAARRLLEGEGGEAPGVVEFTCYHAGPEGIATGAFLPAGAREFVRTLSPSEREMKQRMLGCFATQRETLGWFRVEEERFRPAPAYDFTAPPHEGVPLYEHFGWGEPAARWRARAREALAALGVAEGAPC